MKTLISFLVLAVGSWAQAESERICVTDRFGFESTAPARLEISEKAESDGTFPTTLTLDGKLGGKTEPQTLNLKAEVANTNDRLLNQMVENLSAGLDMSKTRSVIFGIINTDPQFPMRYSGGLLKIYDLQSGQLVRAVMMWGFASGICK